MIDERHWCRSFYLFVSHVRRRHTRTFHVLIIVVIMLTAAIELKRHIEHAYGTSYMHCELLMWKKDFMEPHLENINPFTQCTIRHDAESCRALYVSFSWQNPVYLERHTLQRESNRVQAFANWLFMQALFNLLRRKEDQEYNNKETNKPQNVAMWNVGRTCIFTQKMKFRRIKIWKKKKKTQQKRSRGCITFTLRVENTNVTFHRALEKALDERIFGFYVRLVSQKTRLSHSQHERTVHSLCILTQHIMRQ